MYGVHVTIRMNERAPWWKEATIYQIYPRSFNDTNGDGIGDIPGIVEKLDYLDDLGVDTVWLSPVYRSPQVDNGYDVSDYRTIAEEYGTMADWERLLSGLHDRGLRLIMDLVINHTSVEHEWFLDARQSVDSEYREYYFWRSAENEEKDEDDRAVVSHGSRPNNWQALWGGPAWTYDDATGEQYLHLFHDRQAELNWDNPAVREDLFEVAEWWLDKGVDGFRLDSINLISKPDGLPDADPEEGLTGLDAVVNGPRVEEYLRAFCDRIATDEDVVAIGEMPELSVEETRRYVGDESQSMSMLLTFEHMELDRGSGARWTPREWDLPELKDTIDRWQRTLAGDGWQGLYFNNHDQPRAVSRLGSDEYRRESATVLATLLFSLRGTPLLYQGEELGMTNPRFEHREEIRDIATIKSIAYAIEEGDISGFDEVKEFVNDRTRDNARTPMQWNDRKNAGFTGGEPWIEVNDNYERVNAERERENSDSVWHNYRRLIALRKEYPVLVHGDFRLLLPEHQEIFSYIRTHDGERVFVVLNFSQQTPQFFVPDEITVDDAEVLYHNDTRPDPESMIDGDVDLRPYEASIYRLS